MFVLYALIYPLGALILAVLAAHFFPFPIPEPLTFRDQLLYFMYQFVDYLLALFMLFFCFLLLRRIVKRSFAFLLQLPIPLNHWSRLKHMVPIFFSVAVISYLLQYMFIHTLIGVGAIVLFEWFSRKGIKLLKG